MRLGVLLMPTDPWGDTVVRVREIEAMGYHHLWVLRPPSWQRYRDRPWYGIYPWLAGVATASTRIRLGTMVANPNIRHPLLLAKDAMTIDHVSHGRFTLGIGAVVSDSTPPSSARNPCHPASGLIGWRNTCR